MPQHGSCMRMDRQLIGKIATIEPSTIDPCPARIAGLGNQVGTVRVVIGGPTQQANGRRKSHHDRARVMSVDAATASSTRYRPRAQRVERPQEGGARDGPLIPFADCRKPKLTPVKE